MLILRHPKHRGKGVKHVRKVNELKIKQDRFLKHKKYKECENLKIPLIKANETFVCSNICHIYYLLTYLFPYVLQAQIRST